MNKKWTKAVLLMLFAAGIAIWHIRSTGATDMPPNIPLNAKPDTVHYQSDSAQLAMIESQKTTSSPLPLTESLSARVVYNEDETARIGVGVSGRIVNVKVIPGDTVKAGQVLAEIDSPDFGAARADLNKARAEENRKRLTLERAKILVPGEAISTREWEAAQAEYSEAKAETLRAEQRLKNINPGGFPVYGQRLSLISPLAGVVTERNATPALEVNPSLSEPLFVVTNPKHLWLLIDVPERLLGRIKVGSDVAVKSDAYPNEHFMAKIIKRGWIVDPNSRRVTVRARLDNPNFKLLPEMFVRASVLQNSGTGVRVPNSAIVNGGIYSFVFVEVAPGEFHRQKVQLLTRGSNFSYIGKGLQGNERVVTQGALLLDAELGEGKVS